MSIINSPEKLPSVDRLLNDPQVTLLIPQYNVALVTQSIRESLEAARKKVLSGQTIETDSLITDIKELTRLSIRPTLRPVFNLTGTILHTNLGRAVLPESAISAMNEVARGASNIEFDLDTGKRGDRHKHIETLVRQLTGAEAALVVNNNAAAVMLTLNSLALRKQVPVSRGELIEIGGAFRMPDIMARAGCKLVEVGTTNRTHEADYMKAISNKTALVMKIHTSNYVIEGFSKAVTEKDLARIAHDHNLPMVSDLGSGTLVNLEDFSLPHEPTVRETLAAGADLVTFSGDKLLGGPQAGIIAGRRDLIEKIKRNPMTRAMRPDKLTLAALHAVLSLYITPGQLVNELPTLRYLTRNIESITQAAQRLLPAVEKCCPKFQTSICPSLSQVGSGALPANTLQSMALKITPPATSGREKTRPNQSLDSLAQTFRKLPIPVIGRITENAFWLDLRCLEDEEKFIRNLQAMAAL